MIFSDKTGDNRRQTLPNLGKNEALKTEGLTSKQKKTASKGSIAKGLYDLDKLLYNLENTIQLADDDSDSTQTKSELDIPTARKSSYDTPKPPAEGQVRRTENDKLTQKYELAYAVNELNNELLQDMQPENSTTNDVFCDDESKPNETTLVKKKSNPSCENSNSKPAIAPKPTVRLSKSLLPSAQPKSVPASYPKPVVPYAKVNIGKKSISSK